jgi:hypothetical protein
MVLFCLSCIKSSVPLKRQFFWDKKRSKKLLSGIFLDFDQTTKIRIYLFLFKWFEISFHVFLEDII